jgi:hypothetical protein
MLYRGIQTQPFALLVIPQGAHFPFSASGAVLNLLQDAG